MRVKATKYKVPEDVLQALIDIGKCQACGDPYDCVDHCHTSGAFRGLLCHPCNKALGFVKDDVERLDNLKRYLQSVAG